MIERVVIRRPDDMHVHGRNGKMSRLVVPFTTQVFARAVMEPNTDPILETGEQAMRYQRFISSAGDSGFQALPTILITPRTRPKTIIEADKAGVSVAKILPKGVTTNSEDGISDFFGRTLHRVLATAEGVGMIIQLHGEMPGVGMMEAEEAFLPILIEYARRFPRLKIVLEHVSTARGIETVEGLPENVAATLTVHHALLTRDDVLGRVHNFCKPVAKTEEDRRAVVRAMTSGNPKFFYGSDSAPHPRELKECAKAKAGIFTPGKVALSRLAQIFEEMGTLDKLDGFTSRFGAERYCLSLNEGEVELVRRPCRVPLSYRYGAIEVVPFMAGEEIRWSVDKVEGKKLI